MAAERSCICGTPLYELPEQWRDPTTRRSSSDVYSYGVTLSEIVTSNRAWIVGIEIPAHVQDRKACFKYELEQHVLGNKSPSRPTIPGYVPDSWRSLIESCWRDDPNLRPSMRSVVYELTTRLEDFVVGRFRDANMNEILDYIDHMNAQSLHNPRL